MAESNFVDYVKISSFARADGAMHLYWAKYVPQGWS